MMVPAFKRGDPLNVDNWRQIEVMVQLGLLQEGLLSKRLAIHVRLCISPGQSRYSRDVGDAQLLLGGVLAILQTQKRSAWCIFGDLWKAFPRTWRQRLLHLCHARAGISDGSWSLLASILSFDRVVVTIGGHTVIVVEQGISEGGLVGTFAFNLLPDELVRDLLSNDHGIGVDIQMPPAWQDYIWQGCGTPNAGLVEAVHQALQSGMGLPTVELLASYAELEASALRALDRTATLRVVAALHADDPVLLDSSLGGAQSILDRASRWAWKKKTAFSTNCGKTVFQYAGCSDEVHQCVQDGWLQLPIVSAAPVSFCYVDQQKWLGLQWRSDLHFLPALHAAVRSASAEFSSLCGLVGSGSLPLSLAIDMFEVKMEGIMWVGRWLFIIEDEAQEILDSCYENWARGLLAAPRWRSGLISAGELGWHQSGFQRGLVDLAMRRAKLWGLPSDDMYAEDFFEIVISWNLYRYTCVYIYIYIYIITWLNDTSPFCWCSRTVGIHLQGC